MLKPKSFLFIVIMAVSLYVLVRVERFLIEPANPQWLHFGKYGWTIVGHGLAGAAAMLVAPFQFSDRLRTYSPRLHRTLGYVYVIGMMVLAPLGAVMQYNAETLHGWPRSFTVLAVVLAVLQVFTTAVALFFAVRRRLSAHRQWMARSYAVGLVFFANRFVLGVTGIESVEMVQAVIWTCMALAVPLADLANDAAEVRRALRAPTNAAAVGAVSASVAPLA